MPICREVCSRRERAISLRWYWSFSTASRTRRRVSSVTLALSFSTRDTVIVLTCASLATSLMRAVRCVEIAITLLASVCTKGHGETVMGTRLTSMGDAPQNHQSGESSEVKVDAGSPAALNRLVSK